MFYPMFAMVLLTFVVLLINFIWRVRAVRSRQVSIKYFRVFDGVEAPEYIKAGARHYANLFELPVLFYVACLVTMLFQQQQSVILLILAWIFVISRVIHAVIHMSYNNVVHRMAAFWGGVLALFGMWIVLLLHYASRSLA
jgi:hypothetical protein